MLQNPLCTVPSSRSLSNSPEQSESLYSDHTPSNLSTLFSCACRINCSRLCNSAHQILPVRDCTGDWAFWGVFSRKRPKDMTVLPLEQSKGTMIVQLWELELEDFDNDDKVLFSRRCGRTSTVWKWERLCLKPEGSPKHMPPCFQHPKIVNLKIKLMFGRSLTEHLKATPSSKLLSPQDVMLDVVPGVLQGFWVPPRSTFPNMPSQRLSEMAVGVTKGPPTNH